MPIAVKPVAPFSRERLIRFLEDRKIATRLVFAGNLIRQPAYKNIEYRKVSDLSVSDTVMNQSFWIGVYPGLHSDQIAYIIDTFHQAVHMKEPVLAVAE